MAANFIYADMPANKRKKALEQLASSVHEEEYGKAIAEEDLAKEKDQYAKDAMKLQQMEAELKKIADAHKAEIKAHEAVMSERLELIKTGRRATKGLLYGIPNRDKGIIVYYDVTGEEIYTEPMSEKDNQGGLFLDAEHPEDGIADVEYEEVTEEEKEDLYNGEEPAEEEPKKKTKKKKDS